MNLPTLFLQEMQTLLKGDFDAFVNSYEQPKTNGLRINNLKVTKEQFQQDFFGDLKPINWCENGFYCDNENGLTKMSKSPLYAAGLYYLQEPSAMLPVEVLGVNIGDYVLDLCAAPGGKTTQIAAKMGGGGVLVANDISAGRCKPLIKNMNLHGVKTAVVLSENPLKLSQTFPKYFNKILVDAPCSGEGMFRKDITVSNNWKSASENIYPKMQIEILQQAAQMLAVGGSLVYSTCTFNTNENEQIIKQFLDNNEEFELISIEHERLQIEKGFAINEDKQFEKCGRIFPHKQNAEGHFVALIKRKGEFSPNNFPFAKVEIDEFNQFQKENLNLNISGNFVYHKNSLFVQPSNLPDLKGLRVASSGFYLGDIKNNREKNQFEPSQNFALALKANEFKNVVNFQLDDERVYRYLKGETIFTEGNEGKNGWCLVCVCGFPLGFGKLQNGQMKNKYEKSWLI